MKNVLSATSLRTAIPVATLIVCVTLIACGGQRQTAPSIAARSLDTPQIPRCTSDRRPLYTIMQIPPIPNTHQTPSGFLQTLHRDIMAQVEKRKIWEVVPDSAAIDGVVVFEVSLLSWGDAADASGRRGAMSMKLSLIDKLLQCAINETTGEGIVDLESTEGIGSVAKIADDAGWFVENVMVHNPSN